MTDAEFNQQYDKATSWANRLLNELVEGEYFASLSAENLFEALCERMEEQMNTEESEIKSILCVIADRLGRLEEIGAYDQT
jgi:hypothetical protein